jgi:exodeoxyribonuclease VII large subunit
MFSSYASKLKTSLKDGDLVLIRGRINVYEARGTYSINASEVIFDSKGMLLIQFEELKAKLASEGLFDTKYKKPLPKYPFKIGVATASSGAALRDIVSTIKRRWPLANIIVFPCLVQGEGASESIINALENSKKCDIDVMIVGRGGGSIEDLWCFNNEKLAYYIYEYPIPIVSAVGHEVDFTICDFVADVRAATPTGAAELVTPDINEIIGSLEVYKDSLKKNIDGLITSNRMYISTLSANFNKEALVSLINRKKDAIFTNRLIINNLINSLYKDNMYVINQEVSKLKNSFKDYKNKKANELHNLISSLDNLSPLKVMLRGYSVVKTSEKTITSVKDINVDDVVQVKVSDGRFYANVTKKEEQ